MTNAALVRLLAVVVAGSLAVACASDPYGGDVLASHSSTPSSSSSDSASTKGASTTGSSTTAANVVTNAPAPKSTAASTDTATPAATDTATTLATVTTPPAAAPACNTDTDSVTASYKIALLRAPDAGGLQFYLTQLQAGAESRLDVLDAFVQSDEYLNLRAGFTNTQFATGLYTGLLGRQPDQAGLDFWTNQLANEISRAAVSSAFVHSDEFADPNKNTSFACYF